MLRKFWFIQGSEVEKISSGGCHCTKSLKTIASMVFWVVFSNSKLNVLLHV